MSRRLLIALLPLAMATAASAVPMAAAAAAQAAKSSAVTHGYAPVAVLAAKPATAEQLWQLRSALNVAALMCQDKAVVAGYNWLLRTQAPLLANAWATEQQRYRASHGGTWQLAQDRALTSQYNRLANTDNRARFCTEAASIMAEAQMVPPAMFAHFAGSAAPRLSGLARAPELARR